MKPQPILLAVLLTIVSCRAQQTGTPKLVKTQNTTPHANVQCAIQDKAGDLWFGTAGEGVYRYDGKLFKQYTTNNGLTSNKVYSMLEDRNGFIWLGTDSGLCRYNGDTIETVIIRNTVPASFYINSTPAHKNEVWSIMQDKRGMIWFGTREGLYYYDGEAFKRFLDNPNVVNGENLNLQMVECMLEDKNGVMWFGSGMLPGSEGIIRYDGKTLTSYKPEGNGWIRYLIEDKRGNIWIGTRMKGVWRYDGKEFSKFIDGVDIGLSALVDKSGNVWFSGGEKTDGFTSDGGLRVYDGTALKPLNMPGDSIAYSIWCMLEDNVGNIWFGTRNVGLYRYDGKRVVNYSAH